MLSWSNDATACPWIIVQGFAEPDLGRHPLLWQHGYFSSFVWNNTRWSNNVYGATPRPRVKFPVKWSAGWAKAWVGNCNREEQVLAMVQLLEILVITFLRRKVCHGEGISLTFVLSTILAGININWWQYWSFCNSRFLSFLLEIFKEIFSKNLFNSRKVSSHYVSSYIRSSK